MLLTFLDTGVSFFFAFLLLLGEVLLSFVFVLRRAFIHLRFWRRREIHIIIGRSEDLWDIFGEVDPFYGSWVILDLHWVERFLLTGLFALSLLPVQRDHPYLLHVGREVHHILLGS